MQIHSRYYQILRFVFSEECPLEQTQAEVYGGGVKCIELSMQDKLPVQPLALSKIDHVVGELFKYPVVPVGIRVGNIAELDVSAAKSEMITLILDGSMIQITSPRLSQLESCPYIITRS